MMLARFARLLIEGPPAETPKQFIQRQGIHADAGDKPAKPEEKNSPTPTAPSTPQERQDPAKIDKRISVYLTRLLLRLRDSPALLSYLADVTLIPDKNGANGQAKIQLDFYRLPEEVYPQLIKLCGAPRTPKLVRYVKGSTAHTGVEIVVKPDDFQGDDYDYAG